MSTTNELNTYIVPGRAISKDVDVVSPRERSEFPSHEQCTYAPQDQYHQQIHFPQKRRKEITEGTRFKDIIGHASVKLRIDELILPLSLPMAISNSIFRGIRSSPASILLYGPPGCGKTKLARAIAGEAHSAFLSVAPSDILSKFVGDSEASIRNIFRRGVEQAIQCRSECAVIFFDEIDALGQSRDNSGTGEGEGCSRRVLSELLLQLNVIANNKYCCLKDFDSNFDIPIQKNMDNANEWTHRPTEYQDDHKVRIIVVAATNRIDDCDAALLRRFGIQLEVCLPTGTDRKVMLCRHLKDIEHTLDKADINSLVTITESWSGSALEHLSREAAMGPIRECLHRAAVIRRRTEKQQQRGGDASGQDDIPQSPDGAAECCLLEGLQQLRAVTVDDYSNAIATLTGENIYIDIKAKYRTQKKVKRSIEHYDTSGSSDEGH